MQNIGIEPNDFLKVTSVSLPRASYAKFQPQSVDFLDISNPKAVYYIRIIFEHLAKVNQIS